MAFFAHLGNNYTYGQPTGSIGYVVYPTPTVTGVLDTIVADLSAATSSGTNNGWSLFDDLRTGSFTGVLPLVNTWSGIVGEYNSIAWTFTTNSITSTAYYTYGRRYEYSISAISGVNTTCSADLVNWVGMYAYGTVGNYTTGVMDRPWPGATVTTPNIYQRVEQWIVLKHTGGQKTFYILMGVPTNRWGGPTLYMMPMEAWDTGTRLPDNGRPQAPPMETTHYYDSSYPPTSGSTMRTQMMVWFLTDAFAIWTGGMVSYRVPTMASFTYVGSLDTSEVRSVDTDALCFIPGQTWYSGLNAASAAQVQNNAAADDQGGGAIQCLRNLNGDPWITPVGQKMTSTYHKNTYQVWPRARPYSWCIDANVIESDGRLVYTEFDVYHGSSNTGAGLYERWGSAVEGRRGKLRYVRCPLNNPNHQEFNTVSGSDGRTYMYFRQGPLGTYTSNGQTLWFTFNNAGVGGLSNSSFNNLMSGWAWGIKNSTTVQIGDVSYNNGVNGSNGFYNYLLMPVSGTGI